MKKHFVPTGRSYGVFSAISTIVLLIIIGIVYIQFTRLRYDKKESVSIQLVEPEKKIATLIDEKEINELYQIINEADKSFDGFHKPTNARGYLFQTDLKELSDEKNKFEEVEPSLVWEQEHIYQGAKSYKITPEAVQKIENMILNE